MADSFRTKARLQHVPDRNSWILLSPLVYVSTRYQLTLEVPAWFETDLASVPRVAWVLIPPSDRHIVEAAIVHDWLYTRLGHVGAVRVLSRRQCDRVLSDALAVDGAPWWYRHAVYWAVRLFGGRVWARHK